MVILTNLNLKNKIEESIQILEDCKNSSILLNELKLIISECIKTINAGSKLLFMGNGGSAAVYAGCGAWRNQIRIPAVTVHGVPRVRLLHLISRCRVRPLCAAAAKSKQNSRSSVQFPPEAREILFDLDVRF